MEENLDRALERALGTLTAAVEAAPTPLSRTTPTEDKDYLGQMAFEKYQRAKDLLRQGLWAEFGKALEELETVLKKMSGEKENKDQR